MKKEGQGSFIFYYFGWIHNCFFFSFFFGMPDTTTPYQMGGFFAIFAFSALI